MPTNLTGSKINETYSQLLHIDGGPAATEKAVLSGTGVATALNLGINSASVGNIKISGNTVSALSGNVELSNVAISGGSITGIVDLPIEDGGTGASTAVGARTNLGLGTMATQNANAVAITGGSISGVTIPFSNISDAKYGQFWSEQDQSLSANVATAATVNNSWSENSGVTVASNSQITYDTAGVYSITTSIQFVNTDSTDRAVWIWFRKNGTDIASSASAVVIPKTSEGGTMMTQVSILQKVAANDYIQVFVSSAVTNVSLDYTAAQTSPVRPITPSVIIFTHRVA